MVEFNNTEIWNFGLPFLKNFYVVYNFEDNVIGFYGGSRYNATTYKIDKKIQDNKEVLVYFALIMFLGLLCYTLVLLFKFLRYRKISAIVFKV